jgi:hypothetical protein
MLWAGETRQKQKRCRRRTAAHRVKVGLPERHHAIPRQAIPSFPGLQGQKPTRSRVDGSSARIIPGLSLSKWMWHLILFFFNLPSSSPSNTTTYVYAFLSLCKHSNSFRLNSLPPMSFRHPLYITSAPPEFENSGKGLNSLHTVGHSCLVVRLGGGESQQQQA